MDEIPYTIKMRGTRRVVVFDCPGCAATLGAPLDRAGREEHCTECGAIFVCPGVEVKEEVRQREAEKERAEAKRVQRERAKAADRDRAGVDAGKGDDRDDGVRPMGVARIGQMTSPNTSTLIRRMRYAGGAMSLLAAVIGGVLVYSLFTSLQSPPETRSVLGGLYVLVAVQVWTLWLAIAVALFGGGQLLEGAAKMLRIADTRWGGTDDASEKISS